MSIREVVDLRCQLGTRRIIFISYYVRPTTKSNIDGQAWKANFAWVRDLRQLYPTDDFIIGGDFNAGHSEWGYTYDSSRGTAVFEEAQAAGLTLANDLEYPTRHSHHSIQGAPNQT